MKDKFQKYHNFDIDLAQYLNDKKIANDKIIHSQDEVVLKCDNFPKKGLKLIMELEIGSMQEIDDRMRQSVMTEDDFDSQRNDSFEELDFGASRKRGDTNIDKFKDYDDSAQDQYKEQIQIKEEEVRILQGELEERSKDVVEKDKTIESLKSAAKE